jgi:hypothetical protein
MSVLRVMGTETEYGISVPGQPGANAMVTSSQIVNAYQAATAAKARRARWDFEEENPLRDARGFDLTREAADSSQLTDEDLPNTTNPDDWARISGKKGERIVYIRTLVSGKTGTEAGRSIDTVANTGQYL